MLLWPLDEGKSIHPKTQLTWANSSPGLTRTTDTMSMANRRVVGVAQSKTVLQTNSLTPKHPPGFLYLWHLLGTSVCSFAWTLVSSQRLTSFLAIFTSPLTTMLSKRWSDSISHYLSTLPVDSAWSPCECLGMLWGKPKKPPEPCLLLCLNITDQTVVLYCSLHAVYSSVLYTGT